MDITKFGAIPSEYDARDYSVKMARAVTFPDEYEQPDVDIYDQGSIGNCVMQAIRSAPHVHYGEEFGATFGYGRWRTHTGEGMRPNEACNGFVKEGIPPVTVDNKWLEMPEAAQYANAEAARMLKAAEPYKGWTWARAYTVDEIKAALVDGNYVIVCVPYVGISNGRWLVSGRVVGYHEMRFLGWKKTGWKIRNSWGKGNSGSLSGTSDGYVAVNFEDAFACNDVIILFPPKKQDKPIIEPRRTLRVKSPYMTGADVTLCQRRLAVHGFTVSIDGIYGRMTAAAVTAFQRVSGLVADGICGAKTWAALDKDPDGGSKYDVDAIESLMRLTVGDHYIIGAQGHELTKEYLDKRKAAAPAYFTNGRYEWLVEQIKLAQRLNRKLYCEDCSGLLMACNDVLGFWPDKDLTAEGIRKRCKKITRAEVRPGDIAFRVVDGEANHMAWVGNAGLYEAVGTVYGVVLRMDIDERKTLNQMTGKVDTRPDWTEWGRPVYY